MLLAQLDRAFVYGTKGQGFESLATHQQKNLLKVLWDSNPGVRSCRSQTANKLLPALAKNLPQATFLNATPPLRRTILWVYDILYSIYSKSFLLTSTFVQILFQKFSQKFSQIMGIIPCKIRFVWFWFVLYWNCCFKSFVLKIKKILGIFFEIM